jgi:hypothetical protein
MWVKEVEGGDDEGCSACYRPGGVQGQGRVEGMKAARFAITLTVNLLFDN